MPRRKSKKETTEPEESSSADLNASADDRPGSGDKKDDRPRSDDRKDDRPRSGRRASDRPRSGRGD